MTPFWERVREILAEVDRRTVDDTARLDTTGGLR